MPKGLTDKGQKRIDAILEAAADLFLEQGYDAIKLDDVVAAAGGSKVTLYRHYGGKEQLLEAVVRHFCLGYERNLRAVAKVGADRLGGFQALAGAIVELALSERQVRFYRLVMENAGRFPVIGEVWFNLGLRAISGMIRDFLAGRTVEHVSEEDLDAMADALHGALVFRVLSEAVVRRRSADPADIERTVRIVTGLFDAFHAASSPKDVI